MHDTWSFTHGRWLARHLPPAHDMFLKLAGHLDFFAHILRRCNLDVEELLDLACRADNPSAMLRDIKKITKRLRHQADVIDALVRIRNDAPHYLPKDDALAWRPVRNLTRDAGYLRRLANVIDRHATTAAEAFAKPRQTPTGAFTVEFRNAINGVYECHPCDTPEEAQRLAQNHRPFNNTAVRITRNDAAGTVELCPRHADAEQPKDGCKACEDH